MGAFKLSYEEKNVNPLRVVYSKNEPQESSVNYYLPAMNLPSITIPSHA
mgnify:CR=1 FL=1